MLTILIGLTDDWTEALKHFQSILRDRERENDANDRLSLIVETVIWWWKQGVGGLGMRNSWNSFHWKKWKVKLVILFDTIKIGDFGLTRWCKHWTFYFTEKLQRKNHHYLLWKQGGFGLTGWSKQLTKLIGCCRQPPYILDHLDDIISYIIHLNLTPIIFQPQNMIYFTDTTKTWTHNNCLPIFVWFLERFLKIHFIMGDQIIEFVSKR